MHQCGCVLFTDCVLHCGILVQSFQDAAIMLTFSLSCHTLLEVLSSDSMCCSLLAIFDLRMLLTLCSVPCTKHHIKVVKSSSSIIVTQCSYSVLIVFGVYLVYVTVRCYSFLDNRDPIVLPGSFVFSKQYLPLSLQSGRLPLYLLQIQAPSPRLGNSGHPLHLLLSGKPMVCGFCLGSMCYI